MGQESVCDLALSSDSGLLTGYSQGVRWGCGLIERFAWDWGSASKLTLVVVGRIFFLTGCWSEGLRSLLAAGLLLFPMGLPKGSLQHGGWLPQREQLKGQKSVRKAEPHGAEFVQPQLQEWHSLLSLYSTCWKQVIRSSPHSRRKSHKDTIPGW